MCVFVLKHHRLSHNTHSDNSSFFIKKIHLVFWLGTIFFVVRQKSIHTYIFLCKFCCELHFLGAFARRNKMLSQCKVNIYFFSIYNARKHSFYFNGIMLKIQFIWTHSLPTETKKQHSNESVKRALCHIINTKVVKVVKTSSLTISAISGAL